MSVSQQLAAVLVDMTNQHYYERAINSWNRLPTEVVTAPSLGVFKTKLDIFACILYPFSKCLKK